jgi:glycosyltransferase involved in cell wall biosynthesis
MKRRLVILTEIISPYRIPLFNALASNSDVDLHVIFLAETVPSLRQWRVYREEIRFSHQVLGSWRKRLGRYNALLNRGVSGALVAANPDVILCGGYNYVASWQSLHWARSHDIPVLLWSESNVQDQRSGHALVEFLKSEFISGCRGFVVPGRSAQEYLRVKKVNPEKIFTAPNAVDNNLFASHTAIARTHKVVRRRELNLPERYFLFVGRIVPEKGVFDLLSAYSRLNASIREQVGLVYVGDGESKHQLEQRSVATSPGVIRFSGFAQREELASYYALAEALVLPTHTDPWGLVVNEAMGCGLPVILSSAAGCASDLLREGETGLLIPPRDVDALTSAMARIADQPELRESMGNNARQVIMNYSPEAWSTAIALAVTATVSTNA